MTQIIVCYLRSSSDLLEDHILNRLAAFRAPRCSAQEGEPMVHTELYFPDTNNRNTGLSAGIHYGGTMFMYPKSFKRSDWVFHSIPASSQQIAKAKAFCRRQMGATFNYAGFYLPPMCNVSHSYRVKNSGHKRMPWYCSELVSYALLHAGIIDNTTAKMAAAHPNQTFHAISEACDVFMDSARSLHDTSITL